MADTVILKNGDKVSGTIAERTEEYLLLQSELLGDLRVDNAHIDDVVTEEAQELVEPPAPEPLSLSDETADAPAAPTEAEVQAKPSVPVEEKPKAKWDNKLSMGYNKGGGNTYNSSGFVSLKLKRKQEFNELAVRAETYYASNNRKMTAQKHFWEIRDDFRDAKDPKWFNFVRFQADHDRFSNIDYRLIPSIGRGYHLVEGPKFNAILEASVGYQHSEYNDGTPSEGEAVLVPRAYADKTLWRGLKIAQDLTVYPSLEEIHDYRVKSETNLTQPLTDRLSWKVSFIDEYNSNPSNDAKKNDYRLITGINYKF